MGAWIETILMYANYANIFVSPFMGVWIETGISPLPSRPIFVALRKGRVD